MFNIAISYKRLFKLLEVKGKNKYWLRQNGILPNTVDRLVKDKHVSTEIIERICVLLECNFNDIVEYVPEIKEKPDE